MKYSLFILVSLILSFTAAAQLEEQTAVAWKTIGELKTFGITKAKMQYSAAGSDKVFMLLMKDFRKQPETNYFSVVFNNAGNAFDKCFELFLSFFTDENRANKDYMKTVKLGKSMVNIQHQALIGSPGIRLTTNDGFITFSRHDIHKLFGR